MPRPRRGLVPCCLQALAHQMVARELVVSLNTVRTHTKHIYAKLGVDNRRAAVRRSHELHLVSRTRDR